MFDTDELASVARSAASSAGNFILDKAADINSLQIEEKSQNDFVSEVDRGAESIIREHIRRHFPTHRILGEELGASDQQASLCWVIDPLDGTTNFLRDIPHYAVSIAVLENGRPVVACVFDPAKNEFFEAKDGRGATLNGRQITVSDRSSLSGGLYATGVPFSGVLLENLDCFTATMESILRAKTSGIRRLGSAALDLAYVAAGRYDGYWEANLKIWDIAAGVLLVQEAAGVVSDLTGGANHLNSGHILASNFGAYNELLEITQTHYQDWKTG